MLSLSWFFLHSKTYIIFVCNHPSWEQGGRDISFHMVCDTEPEMEHCCVQTSLSLRDDLRLPDQFWQVTGSFQGKHICVKGQAGFHVVSKNPPVPNRSQIADSLGLWVHLIFVWSKTRKPHMHIPPQLQHILQLFASWLMHFLIFTHWCGKSFCICTAFIGYWIKLFQPVA